MRWLSRQSTFKVGKRKTENVRWFSIRIFPFVKLGIGSGAYPQGAAGGREAAGVGACRGILRLRGGVVAEAARPVSYMNAHGPLQSASQIRSDLARRIF